MREVRQRRTIAVASGKGGVGKSNVSLNLAILLAAAGNRVALVDGDMGLANLDLLVNADVRANLYHVISGSKALREIVVDLPCGVQFIPGASGLTKMANLTEFQRARLLEELASLEADNDIIIVDCGAGIGADVINLAAAADHVLTVTAPEPTSITDAYALIKVLTQRNFEGQISVLVNFAAGRHEARLAYERLSEVTRQFLSTRIYDAGHIPTDPHVPEAVCRREPVVLAYPKCEASRGLAALATRLSAGNLMVQARDGFFRRVARWFA